MGCRLRYSRIRTKPRTSLNTLLRRKWWRCAQHTLRRNLPDRWLHTAGKPQARTHAARRPRSTAPSASHTRIATGCPTTPTTRGSSTSASATSSRPTSSASGLWRTSRRLRTSTGARRRVFRPPRRLGLATDERAPLLSDAHTGQFSAASCGRTARASAAGGFSQLPHAVAHTGSRCACGASTSRHTTLPQRQRV